jgi:hypothetical protein
MNEKVTWSDVERLTRLYEARDTLEDCADAFIRAGVDCYALTLAENILKALIKDFEQNGALKGQGL